MGRETAEGDQGVQVRCPALVRFCLLQAFAETFPARGTKRGGGAAGGGAGTPRATKAQKAEAVSEAYDGGCSGREADTGCVDRGMKGSSSGASGDGAARGHTSDCGVRA